MALTINHQTNDISATSGSVTIDGVAVGTVGPLLQMDSITASQTYTATRTSKALLVAIGAGGRGGYYTSSSDVVAASGGGSGALCAKMVDIAVGETLSITIGADNTTQGLANFSGATTITGTLAFGSVSLSGGGGQCGENDAGTSGLQTATGASGGSATGGDLNIDGMGSGTAERNGPSGEAATSGGSVRFDAAHPTATPDVIGTTGSTAGAQELLPPFIRNMVDMNGGKASTATTSDGTESGRGAGGYGFASTNGSVGGISNNGGNGIAYVVYFGDPSV